MQDWDVALGFLIGSAIVLAIMAAPVLYLLRRTKAYRQHVDMIDEVGRSRAEYASAGLLKTSFWSGDSAAGTHRGVAFTGKIVMQGKMATSVLAAGTALRGEFALRREAGGDRFFKSVGFTQEAQTGDAAFDHEFYLLGRSRAYVEALFADARNRAAVRALMALGFDHLEVRNGSLEMTKLQHGALPTLSVARAACEVVATLREPPAATQLAGASEGGLSTRVISEASGIAFLVAVIAMGAAMYRTGGDNLVGAIVAAFVELSRWLIPALVVAVAGGAFALRGRAAAAQELALVALGVASCILAGLSLKLFFGQGA